MSAKLSAALRAADGSDNGTACDILGTLENEVDALSGRMISSAGLKQLTFANTRLQTALGCH